MKWLPFRFKIGNRVQIFMHITTYLRYEVFSRYPHISGGLGEIAEERTTIFNDLGVERE